MTITFDLKMVHESPTIYTKISRGERRGEKTNFNDVTIVLQEQWIPARGPRTLRRYMERLQESASALKVGKILKSF